MLTTARWVLTRKDRPTPMKDRRRSPPNLSLHCVWCSHLLRRETIKDEVEDWTSFSPSPAGNRRPSVMTLKTVPLTNRDRQPSSHSLHYSWCPSPPRVPHPEAINLATGFQGPPPLRGWRLASRCRTPALEWETPPGRKPSFDADESPHPSTPSAATSYPTSGGASGIGVDTARTPATAETPCHRRCSRRSDDARSVLMDRTLLSKDSKFQDYWRWLRPLATAGP